VEAAVPGDEGQVVDRQDHGGGEVQGVEAAKVAVDCQFAASSTSAWSTSTIPKAGHSSRIGFVAAMPAARPTARTVSANPALHMNHPSARSIVSRTISLPGSFT
jgi:hypothetical protein